MEIPFFIVFIGSWLGISWGIYRLFNIASDIASSNTKTKFGNWLKNYSIDTSDNWTEYFIAQFDKLFPFRKSPFKFVLRSALSSISVILLLTLLFDIKNPDSLNYYEIGGGSYFFNGLNAILLFNIYPDMISLFVSRWLLSKMSPSSSLLFILKYLLLDIFLTALVFFVYTFIMTLVYCTIIWFDEGVFQFSLSTQLSNYHANYFTLTGTNDIKTTGAVGIFFYSTFFTSFWFLLYFLSAVIVKMVAKTNRGLEFLKSSLELETKPLKSLGFFALLFITTLYLIWGVFLVINYILS